MLRKVLLSVFIIVAMSKKKRFLVFDLASSLRSPLCAYCFESDAMSLCHSLHSASDMRVCIYDMVLMRYFFFV